MISPTPNIIRTKQDKSIVGKCQADGMLLKTMGFPSISVLM